MINGTNYGHTKTNISNVKLWSSPFACCPDALQPHHTTMILILFSMARDAIAAYVCVRPSAMHHFGHRLTNQIDSDKRPMRVKTNTALARSCYDKHSSFHHWHCAHQISFILIDTIHTDQLHLVARVCALCVDCRLSTAAADVTASCRWNIISFFCHSSHFHFWSEKAR